MAWDRPLLLIVNNFPDINDSQHRLFSIFSPRLWSPYHGLLTPQLVNSLERAALLSPTKMQIHQKKQRGSKGNM
jgi:hypothetical protein